MTTQLQAVDAPVTPPDSDSSFPMFRTLGGLALLSGCLLSLVFQLTKDRIEHNFEERVREAVFELLPGATEQKILEFIGTDERIGEVPFTAYAGYDETGRLIGVALEAVDGNGYSGEIRFLYGYLPDKERVVGMKVLLCKETPGLGDKIKTDENFIANFRQLDVTLNEDASALEVPLSFAKPGQGGGRGQIEGISGATISSKSVFQAIDSSTRLKLPVIQHHLSELQEN
ncbi:MAG: FMN-binding protein [Candidatus Hydrogenedentes bacterium]|nr:FMN-binding protein [Candidatus Hydrogenedentota bacterium]